MDFRQMLLEMMLGGQPPMPSQPGGLMGRSQAAAPPFSLQNLIPEAQPPMPGGMMGRSQAMNGPPPTPTLPPGGGVGGQPMDSMAMNPLPMGGPFALPQAPGMAGSGMSPHAGPASPSLLAPPQPDPTGAPPAMPGGVESPSFGQQALGLLGGRGRSLYDILGDAMAGVAASDPTAPPLKAAAQGFTGTRVSNKARKTEAEAAEDKRYEREGTELDREVKRGEWENTKKLAPLQRAKTAAEVKDTLDYSKRQKQIDAAALDSISRDTLLTPEEKIAKIREYLGGEQTQQQEWSPDSGKPPPVGYKRYDKDGRAVQWDGKQWVEVPTS